MTQKVPFPPRGRVTRFNSSLLDAGGLVVEEFEIRNILSAYNKRNGKCIIMKDKIAKIASSLFGGSTVHPMSKSQDTFLFPSAGIWTLLIIPLPS